MSADHDLETRRQSAYRRLGTEHPVCVSCGEADWRCLELHHLAGRAYDPAGVILCRNDHRKLTDPSANEADPTAPPLLERVGHLLVGLAEFLVELATRLHQLGAELLEGARVCPWPYGWIGAPVARS